jgi:D-alanyl-D-alanine carboxypeptidase (penicillin-binding protein 5/6)
MIYSRNSYTEVAQASTTKLMTAVLLLESGLIDSTTMISAHAAATPYGSGRMVAGDIYNTRDLLYAMLLPSANDAATAVAERVGGSEEVFVNMMNAKAAKLGLTRTHFRNPHGLDADGHYTTAKELAELTAYAYTFPEIRDCWATQYKAIRSLEKGRRWHLWSTNAIFGYISNFLGGKTGTEDNAGCCFTGVYTFNGDTYVTVVLGSGYGFSRWRDTKKLHGYIHDYALSQY